MSGVIDLQQAISWYLNLDLWDWAYKILILFNAHKKYLVDSTSNYWQKRVEE